jgi:hypothetical protein
MLINSLILLFAVDFKFLKYMKNELSGKILFELNGMTVAKLYSKKS